MLCIVCVFVQWGYAVGWLCSLPTGNLAADVSTLLWAGDCSQPAASSVRKDEGRRQGMMRGGLRAWVTVDCLCTMCRVPDQEQKLNVICHHLARLEELLVAGFAKCSVLRMQHPVWVC